MSSMGDNIVRRLDALAACTDVPGQITRLYLSPSHAKSIELVRGWMAAAGLDVTVDAVGSVVGRSHGAAHNARALIMASHIDSVPNGGKFDGTLGVLAALEAVDEFRRRGKPLPVPVEIIAFGDEEGTRFASTLGGSRAIAGQFDASTLDEADANGITRRAALQAFGCNPDDIAGLRRDPDRYLGYIEVHIEQGPVLEAADQALGIVTAINGATRGSVEVVGEVGHAGTVPMPLRRDALTAAAEMALAVEARARSEADLVATVGRLETPGGVVNSVAGLVRFTLDVRSPSDARRKIAVDDIRARIEEIATRRGVTARITLGYNAPAAPCDPGMTDRLAAAVAPDAKNPIRMPSGAGHDAMSLRGVMPIAMMFVRCRGGVSHSPAEFTTTADIDAAARALVRFIEGLAAT